MAILSEAALEFAREHIQRYYDSDFFPKPIEFEALWYQWDAVKTELLSKNISKLWVTPPRAMTVGKPKGGFRVVHQLEPIDAIVYTALAFEAAPSIEAARMRISRQAGPGFHVMLGHRFTACRSSISRMSGHPF